MAVEREERGEPWLQIMEIRSIEIGGGTGGGGEVGAEPEYRPPKLENIAIRERSLVDRIAIQEGAISGAEVFDRPLPAPADQARVVGRHRLARNLHPKLAIAPVCRSAGGPVDTSADDCTADSGEGPGAGGK